MKKILNNLFDQTFLKFICVGVINTLFGTGIMFVFYNVLYLNYWISSASNYVFGSILSYFLNRYFTFRDDSKSVQSIWKFVINISVCYLVAYGFAKPLCKLTLSTFSLSLQENIAMVVGMCIFVGLNYLGQRFWVFKK